MLSPAHAVVAADLELLLGTPRLQQLLGGVRSLAVRVLGEPDLPGAALLLDDDYRPVLTDGLLAALDHEGLVVLHVDLYEVHGVELKVVQPAHRDALAVVLD